MGESEIRMKSLIFWTGLLIILLVVGCNIGIPTVEQTSSSQVAKPSQSASPTALSRHPTLTWTPSPIPTYTAVPTLPIDEAKDLAADLLMNNAGCSLPCWWGFTPGETSWETVRDLLGQLDDDLFVVELEDSVFFANPKIPVPTELVSIYPSYIYVVRDGIISSIEIYDYIGHPNFTFIEILTTYGKPNEVWIRTYSSDYDGGMPFGVALFYKDIGLTIQYHWPGQLIDNKIQGCFPHAGIPWIWVWDPAEELTFLEGDGVLRWYQERWPFLPLGESSEIDVDTFYELFMNPSNTICIETPAELWPVQ